MSADAELHVRAGQTADGPFAAVITPESAGWGYSGLRVLELPPGGSHTIDTGDAEHLVLPLSGGCRVECEGRTVDVAGREHVFDRVTDFVYLPRAAEALISSRDGGRFALPSARCERRLPVRYGPAEQVPVEPRGAGNCSRQVNGYCMPDGFPADRLLVCEVLTPGGNWSSYPPHKHDETREGESRLEEIYYFGIASGPAGPGVAYQRVYGTPGRPLDVLAEVRDGDAVLIPHGWHGPSMAAPGYDLYYLNVMAGPAPERAWLICDDPAHAWVRGTWDTVTLDPRVPLTSAGGRVRKEA
ncbi:5-deoxy-glucuronate isomerase [Spirillospora sp. CA-142024]|uniref:5-deoxy-glucuronate isomerase n=1 Tax=Spirillospora sp. CA-142024 TaxID=3240036 RepID=UPI003D89F8D5